MTRPFSRFAGKTVIDRRRLVLVGLVLVVAGLALATAGTSVAAAQAEENATATEEEEEERTVEAEVDSRLRVLDFEYNATAETFVVRFENVGERRASTVTVTEAIGRGGGSKTFGIERFKVRPGETVSVSVSARRVEGAAGVMITTEESIDNGEGTYLEEDRSTNWFGEATWSDVRAGILFTAVPLTGSVVVGAWHYLARRDEDVVDASLEGDHR